MIYVISKSTFGSYNVRDIQCNANWDCCPYSDYALIPDSLVDGVLATKGYCDIVLTEDGGTVASFTAREIPSVPEECCGENTVLSVNGKTANTAGEVSLSTEDIGAAATNRVITSADTTTYSGMYRIQQADDVPTDCRYGQLLVMCHSETDTIAQIAIAHGSPKAYIRTATGMSNGVVGTWTDWAQIYTTVNNPAIGEITISKGDWKSSGHGMSCWKYETDDLATYDIPHGGCFIIVMKESATRGTAIAFGWVSGNYNMWRNMLHDDTGSNNWTGWKSAVESIGAIPSDPLVRTQIPSGTDIKAFFSNGKLPLGYYYHYPETAPVNAPLDRTDWWFFNRTPVGTYAMCSSEPNRKWIGTGMNGIFHGWVEIYTSENLTPEVVGAVPTTRKVNGKDLSSDITLGASDVGAAKYEFINGGTIRKTSGGTGFEIHLNPADPPENGAWFFVQRLQAEGNYLVIATTLTNEMYISSKPYGADWSGWSHLATTNNTVPTSRTVNGKALSSDVTLSATDVGAVVGVGQVSVSANTITTSGMYRLQEATDIPSGAQYGQLIVVHGGGDTISQIALNYNSSKMWIRTGHRLYDGVVGNWEAWKRVITEDSFVLDGGTLRITI